MKCTSRETGSLIRTAIIFLPRLLLVSGFSLILCLMLFNPVYGAFIYNDFSDPAFNDITTNGDAGQWTTIYGDALRVSPSVISSRGSAFYNTKQVVTGGFKMRATFLINEYVDGAGPTTPGDNGFDGLAFIFQNDPAGTSAVCGSCTRGFAGLTNIMAVVVTTDPSATETSDDDIFLPPTQPEGPGTNVNVIEPEVNNTTIDYINMTNYPSSGGNDIYMGDLLPHVMYIDYDHSLTTMKIYLDDMVTPKLTLSIDLASILGTPDAYIGFASGSGSSYQAHYILDWFFMTGAPFVLSTDPPDMAMDVLETDPIIIYFSTEIDESTLAGNIRFVDSSGSTVDGTYDLQPDLTTLIWTPDSPLQTASAYTMTLTTNIESDLDNTPMLEDYTFWFMTRNTGPFYVDSVNGDDGNPGTWAMPFQTIERALTAFTPGYSNTAYCTGDFINDSQPILMDSIGGTSGSPWVIRDWTNRSTPVINRGDNQSGFYFENASNITVQGFLIEHFKSGVGGGIHVIGSSGISLISNEIVQGGALTGRRGIQIDGCRDILLDGLNIHDNGASSLGIYLGLGPSTNVIIQNSDIINNPNGIRFDKFNGQNITIDNCNINSSGGGDGIAFLGNTSYANQNVSIYNTSIYNADDGIFMSGSITDNLTISNCNLYNNADAMHLTSEGNGLRILNNVFTGNTGNPIHSDFTNDVVVKGNFISGGTYVDIGNGVQNLVFQSNVILTRVQITAGANFLADDLRNNVIVANGAVVALNILGG